MVLTDDPHVHDTVRLFRDQGKPGGGNRPEVIGANWRLSEVQSLLGLVQLRHLDAFIARRQEIADRYRGGLADVAGVECLPVPPGCHHNFYKMIALVENVEPDQLGARLRAEHDVALGGYVYDVPLHEQAVFRDFANGPLPIAEDLCRRHICPPIYPSLTDAQVDHVIDAIRAQMSVCSGAVPMDQ